MGQIETIMPNNTSQGFTLVELMVAVLIVGILAAVAIPMYTKNIQSTARSEAEGELINAASHMEQLYTSSLSYANATVTTATTGGTIAGWAPSNTALTAAKYTIAFASGSPTTTAYTIIATATAAQTNGQFFEVIALNNQGQHCIKQSSSSLSSCTFGTDPSW